MQTKIAQKIKPALSLLIITGLWSYVSVSRLATSEQTNLHGIVYSVEIVTVGTATEYRFKLDERHFGTLIDQNGTYAFRPHPGCDINGWGSTWYGQPFLPGATLKHTTIESINADSNGIHVIASGKVSQGTSNSYGNWSSDIDFVYDPVRQITSGTGQFSITLTGLLSNATGDLNLYKLASNYLDDVPLLYGGNGDTGDMKEAIIWKDNGSIWFIWSPPNKPSHFPTDKTDFLSINVIGQFNNVDTKAMGYAPIAAAFKPSLKIDIISQQPK